jgi:hypothetical protein
VKRVDEQQRRELAGSEADDGSAMHALDATASTNGARGCDSAGFVTVETARARLVGAVVRECTMRRHTAVAIRLNLTHPSSDVEVVGAAVTQLATAIAERGGCVIMFVERGRIGGRAHAHAIAIVPVDSNDKQGRAKAAESLAREWSTATGAMIPADIKKVARAVGGSRTLADARRANSIRDNIARVLKYQAKSLTEIPAPRVPSVIYRGHAKGVERAVRALAAAGGVVADAGSRAPKTVCGRNGVECVECGKGVGPRATTCSASCRKRLSRRRSGLLKGRGAAPSVTGQASGPCVTNAASTGSTSQLDPIVLLRLRCIVWLERLCGPSSDSMTSFDTIAELRDDELVECAAKIRRRLDMKKAPTRQQAPQT